ncbi:MAG: hypothetical protein ACNYZI_08430 [Anaerolineales bacterium]
MNDTITFRGEKILNVEPDCSVANGVYRIDGEKIQTKLGVMIRAYCGDDSQIDEFILFITRLKHSVLVEMVSSWIL